MTTVSLNPEAVKGKVAVITGANSGIGLAKATYLAQHDASRIVLACRSLERGEAAAEQVRSAVPADAAQPTVVEVRRLDLASLRSVREFVDGWEKDADGTNGEGRVDWLFCNAGVIVPNAEPGTTEDGFEVTYQANYLSHLLLQTLLLPFLSRAPSPRIISTTSGAGNLVWLDTSTIDKTRTTPLREAWVKRGYNLNCFMLYCDAKALVNLTTRELQLRLLKHPNPEYRKIFVAAYHPGFVNGNMATARPEYGISSLVTWPATLLSRTLALTPEKGAETGLALATTSEELKTVAGRYWDKGRVAWVRKQVEDEEARRLYFERSLKDAGVPEGTI